MNLAVRVCCAATAGILMSGVAFAKATDIGKAEVVVPDAKRTSVEQEERSLQVGTDVFKDDEVQTGHIGAVMLKFTDKTTLKIFPNSKVKLDNYVYDSEKTVLRVGLSLLSGAMRIASGGPHTADKYELRTPQATIGIRGTVIHIVSDDERTVVEALHGAFHACATTGSACQTVSATDEMNALHLWSDGRVELARARRDLGVRSALGSSDASATPPVLLSPAVASVSDLAGRDQGGRESNPLIGGDALPSPRLSRPAASVSVVRTPTPSAPGNSDTPATRPALLSPAPTSAGGPEGKARSENDASRSIVAGLFQFNGFDLFSGADPGSGRGAQCFVGGTKILTLDGEQAVETLRVGSWVVTTDGPAKVRWITKQTFRREAGQPWPSAIRPILIEPNAIARNAPCRRLILSPGHSLFLDGWLVPAGRLVNGRTIRRIDYPGGTLEYFNVVLDRHAVIFAENLAVESRHAYNADDQASWDNFAAFRSRYPATCDDVTERFAPLVAGRRQRLKQQLSSLVALRKPPDEPVSLIRRRLSQG